MTDNQVYSGTAFQGQLNVHSWWLPETGYLKFVKGCMGSGKSTELRREASRCKAIGKRHVHISSAKLKGTGRREAIYHAESADIVKVDALNDSTIGKYISSVSVFIIDEVQLFDNESIDYIVEVLLLSEEKYIVCGALQSDYHGNPIGNYGRLESNADEILHLKAWCELCSKMMRPAVYSLRVTEESDLFVEDDGTNYIPVCRAHFRRYEDNSTKIELQRVLKTVKEQVDGNQPTC